MYSDPRDLRRGSAPAIPADEPTKRDGIKSSVRYNRSTTFDTTVPRSKPDADRAPTLLARPIAPKITLDQSEELNVIEAREFAQASLGALDHDDDDDEGLGSAGGILDAFDRLQPFKSADLPTFINVVVIGADSVDRKGFVRKALDIPTASSAHVSERKIPVDGRIHHVRLFDLPIQEVSVDDEEIVEWPDSIEEKVDGALTLVNVTDKTSFENVPGVLSAISKASLPSVLVSTKCDAPIARRQMDIDAIEKRAKKAIGNLGTIQASDGSPDSHKRAMAMILRAIVAGNPDVWRDRHPSSSAHWVTGLLLDDVSRTHLSTRQRAQSSAIRPVSPRQFLGHSRASSELTRGTPKEPGHVRHDSSIMTRSPTDRSLLQPESSQRSFLFEESGSDDGVDDAGDPSRHPLFSTAPFNSESGATFEGLVDRLLSQPISKADSKLATIFLALYRKFAAPGRLLDAMVRRFEALEFKDGRYMIKTVEQMRHLAVLEQWIGSYPGDFAYPATKQKMRNFISRISQSRMFAVAAKEMGTHLDMVKTDDDTIWCFTDMDRDPALEDGSVRSPQIPERTPEVYTNASQEERGLAIAMDRGDSSPLLASFPASSQLVLSAETAQTQAQLLRPTERQVLSKVQWRALMDVPDDVLARELTRMDWILFSSARPRDIIRAVTLKPEEKAQYKNIIFVDMMMHHFNYIANWVANYVLLRDKPKHRSLMLEKLMRVARRLRELNNYHSLGAIIAGVKSTAVHRLNATRELIPPNIAKDWLKLEILMAPSKSYSAYRLAWENTSGERIPYLPLHRRDIVTAEQGNKTFVDADGEKVDGRINWKKFEIMGEVVVGVHRAQGMPWKALSVSRPDPSVRELILDVKLETNEDALYERSVQCEPSANASGPSQKFKEFFKRQAA